MRLRVGWVQVVSFVMVRAKNGFVWYLSFGSPTGVAWPAFRPAGKLKHAPPSMVARRGSADRAGWVKATDDKRDKKLEFGNSGSGGRYGITSDEGRAIVNLPSCRPAKRRRNGVLDGHGIRHALRSIENLETHHVAAGQVP